MKYSDVLLLFEAVPLRLNSETMIGVGEWDLWSPVSEVGALTVDYRVILSVLLSGPTTVLLWINT